MTDTVSRAAELTRLWFSIIFDKLPLFDVSRHLVGCHIAKLLESVSHRAGAVAIRDALNSHLFDARYGKEAIVVIYYNG